MSTIFEIDKLTMLLSSECFLNAWELCGLQSEEVVRRQVQSGCQEIVRSLVKPGRTYWDADFSESRVEFTRIQFREIIHRADINDYDLLIFEKYIAPSKFGLSMGEIIMQFEILTRLFPSEHEKSTEIDEKKICAAINETYNYLNIDPILTKRLDFKSKWDKHLLELTVGLPLYLTDAARSLLRVSGHYFRLMSDIKSKLSYNEFNHLKKWVTESSNNQLGMDVPLSQLP